MNSDDDHLRQVALDARATAYIQDQLTLPTIFCRALSAVLASRAGRCFTLLPAGVAIERAYDFEVGDLLPSNARRLTDHPGGMMRVDTLLDVQAERVHRFISASPGSCCVVDDVQQRPDDPEPFRPDITFAVGEEVYRLLTPDDPIDTVRDAVRAGNWLWHGLVALCAPARLPSRADLADAAALTTCLATVVELHAVAYDGEGFVIWRAGP